jgi:hypothetical protein
MGVEGWTFINAFAVRMGRKPRFIILPLKSSFPKTLSLVNKPKL